MPRRNPGPRLRYLKKRGSWYIVWYDRGRECLRGTGTRDRQEAEIALAGSSAAEVPRTARVIPTRSS
jgi:hypothetical protein